MTNERGSPQAINLKIYLISCLLTCSFDKKPYLRDLLRFVTLMDDQKGWQENDLLFRVVGELCTGVEKFSQL